MTEQPTHSEEYGPCDICGSIALPKFGYFLCRKHGKLKYAQRLVNND